MGVCLFVSALTLLHGKTSKWRMKEVSDDKNMNGDLLVLLYICRISCERLFCMFVERVADRRDVSATRSARKFGSATIKKLDCVHFIDDTREHSRHSKQLEKCQDERVCEGDSRYYLTLICVRTKRTFLLAWTKSKLDCVIKVGQFSCR